MSKSDSAPACFLENSRVLVVDDDDFVRKLISSSIEAEGAIVDIASSGEAALELTKHFEYDLLITDFKMPGIDGIELMHRVKKVNPDIEVIIVTAFGDIEFAVRAMRQGAYDFLTKPISHFSQIVTAAERALEKSAMENELEELRRIVKDKDKFESLIGGSSAMQRVYRRITQVAPTEGTVLIYGETGTGKELVAKAIHKRSGRSDAPFIAVNCGALMEALLESELFGHMKGAFTGALSNKIGLFEAASGGSIFLDEIDSTSPHTQVGLLRVLQDKQIRPVGSVTTKRTNVRIIASTQKNLFELTEKGKFREDLYYRLSAVNIELPPLRKREGDIPLLAEHFLKIACERNSREPGRFLAGAIDLLVEYRWPGNVRELENVIEQAVLYSKKSDIRPSDMRPLLQFDDGMWEESGVRKLSEVEYDEIVKALRFTGNNRARAAQLLGIRRSTLYNKLKKYNIPGDEQSEKQPDNETA